MKANDRDELLRVLEARFTTHRTRHPEVGWDEVRERLSASKTALQSLQALEASGGEPDVVGRDGAQWLFFDCAAESPTGRRSLCYDRAALEARKENKPKDSAVEAGQAMGASLLTEAQYHHLQTLGEFDLKTSSWLLTPAEVRERGGALFGDRRYGRVFTYHNGAESYYAARGFRACVRV